MPAPITTDQVWHVVEKQLFAVLGTVTTRSEARTVGIVYIVRDRKLYISTEQPSWKVQHIENNCNVSMTVPIPKRVPFIPWVRIPAATITFQGEATVHAVEEISADIQRALLRGVEIDEDEVSQLCIIKVTPRGDFLTYGVGVPLLTMRNPEKSQGRVSV
jgi:hypothetical protein